MENNMVINNNCWMACFDILGFENILWYTKEKTGSANLDVVARCYHKEIIRDLERGCKEQETYTNVEIYHFCLSDSFVFFSPDDSPNSFLGMSWVAKQFSVRMVGRQIPFRGSLTIGNFYAEMKKNIFIGRGLIDAYKYAEKQDWIGLVLTPIAINKLSQMNADLTQFLKDYVEYDVPVKKTSGNIEKLFVYRISSVGNIEDSISRMQDRAKERCGQDSKIWNKINKKYENTLKFIKETS